MTAAEAAPPERTPCGWAWLALLSGIISLHPQSTKHCRPGARFNPLSHVGNGGPERLSNSPSVTQLPVVSFKIRRGSQQGQQIPPMGSLIVGGFNPPNYSAGHPLIWDYPKGCPKKKVRRQTSTSIT